MGQGKSAGDDGGQSGDNADELDFGGEPTEEVGPEQSEQGPRDVESSASDLDGPAHDAVFETADELHEQFPIEDIATFIDPADGLPSMQTPGQSPDETQAVPFTYETVVCVEDDREYVEVFYDEHIIKRPPPALELSGRGKYDEFGVPYERLSFSPDEVEERWGYKVVQQGSSAHGDPNFLPVRMRRERCEFYKRQVFSNDDQPNPDEFGHQIVFRNCTARRSNGGAYLSLRDEGIYACDHRSPRDEASIGEQDRKDSLKLRTEPHKIRLPLFGTIGDAVHVDED